MATPPIVDFPTTRGRDLDALELLDRELAAGSSASALAVTPAASGGGTGFGVSNITGVGVAPATPPASAPASPAASGGAGRKKIALCVGVDAYPPPTPCSDV